MSENSFNGEQNTSWNIPGHSSFADILDTVFTSSTDNQPNQNGKLFKCFILFLYIYVLKIFVFYRRHGL